MVGCTKKILWYLLFCEISFFVKAVYKRWARFYVSWQKLSDESCCNYIMQPIQLKNTPSPCTLWVITSQAIITFYTKSTAIFCLVLRPINTVPCVVRATAIQGLDTHLSPVLIIFSTLTALQATGQRLIQLYFNPVRFSCGHLLWLLAVTPMAISQVNVTTRHCVWGLRSCCIVRPQLKLIDYEKCPFTL